MNWIGQAWERLARAGTLGLRGEDERKTRLVNQCVVLAVGSYLAFAGLFSLLPGAYGTYLAFTLGAAVAQLLVIPVVRAGHRALAAAWFLGVCNAHLAAAIYYVGSDVGFQYYFLSFLAAVFLVVPHRAWPLYAFAPLSIYGYLHFTYVTYPGVAPVDPAVAIVMRGSVIVSMSATLALSVFLFDAATRRAEARLAAEHERSEGLLLNILPRSISERLKGGQAIADGFAEVSVLFADIVGFTELSSRLPPDELVRVLNQVFSRFDDLAERHGLEKIKTIGDCYMVACGLPEPRDDHAHATVQMALDMRDELERFDRDTGHGLRIRLGVHSGPVVAGVIGKRKFIYDLWGDTVNIASRMESHGKPGAVHVSEATADRVRELFELEDRGTIAVKGKGEMRTYFVSGPRDGVRHPPT